jgi:hypothetical protein
MERAPPHWSSNIVEYRQGKLPARVLSETTIVQRRLGSQSFESLGVFLGFRDTSSRGESSRLSQERSHGSSTTRRRLGLYNDAHILIEGIEHPNEPLDRETFRGPRNNLGKSGWAARGLRAAWFLHRDSSGTGGVTWLN